LVVQTAHARHRLARRVRDELELVFMIGAVTSQRLVGECGIRGWRELKERLDDRSCAAHVCGPRGAIDPADLERVRLSLALFEQVST
jgi:uncharacterized ferredoxin-like protein